MLRQEPLAEPHQNLSLLATGVAALVGDFDHVSIFVGDSDLFHLMVIALIRFGRDDGTPVSPKLHRKDCMEKGISVSGILLLSVDVTNLADPPLKTHK